MKLAPPDHRANRDYRDRRVTLDHKVYLVPMARPVHKAQRVLLARRDYRDCRVNKVFKARRDLLDRKVLLRQIRDLSWLPVSYIVQ